MMKLKSILYLLLALPFLCGCNNEDDLEAIFQSGTWNVVNLFTTTNWNDNHKFTAIYSSATDIETLNNMSIVFQADGTLTGTLSSNATIQGSWRADGGSRTITINITRTTGNITTNSLNKAVYDHLREVRYYKGDSTMLQLATEGENKYIQLAHY
ncbi:MAG: DUF4847 family protein [Phocaeicola sp.]